MFVWTLERPVVPGASSGGMLAGGLLIAVAGALALRGRRGTADRAVGARVRL